MATLINSVGLEEEIVLESLEQIQAFIGGYFEQIHIEEGLLMVNEDAVAKNLPLNDKASILAKQPIRGNVIFATHAEVAS